MATRRRERKTPTEPGRIYLKTLARLDCAHLDAGGSGNRKPGPGSILMNFPQGPAFVSCTNVSGAKRQSAISMLASTAALRIAFCSFSNARTSICRTRSRLMP